MSQGKSHTSSAPTTVPDAEDARPPLMISSSISADTFPSTIEPDKTSGLLQSDQAAVERDVKSEKKLEEGEIKYSAYETDAPLARPPPRTWLQRHLFIIMTMTVGMIVMGAVLGGVIKITLERRRMGGIDILGYVRLTATDASGHVFTTGMDNMLTSAFMVGVSRSAAAAAASSTTHWQ
ncbi:hypothetical protein M408DRAFT_200586 [Serendipita vermifera MAFF 305830]|uniref:Uncharacterized protein n=1 Tax=Serendipita vermifera MAFF 305830 TaxID=933852 RepID=A0A0C3ANH8_SERVB|nr:hypothetical protein M408DRAFT_200586 [Serendipita vermifera MAFF 305830]